MTFKGWVALRRGVFEHTMDGRLTNNEALIFICLLTLADHTTGSGTTNAPAIRTFLPELSYDAAKRGLLSLEEKRYIWRAIIPFSKRVYRYWIDGYELSDGPYRSLQINLEHVFESNNPKDIRYEKPAPEGALQGALDPALQGALNNNNDKNKDNNNPPLPTGENASLNALDAGRDCILQQSEPGGSIPIASEAFMECVHPASIPSPPPPIRGAGVRWSGSQDVGYLDMATGEPVSTDDALRRIRDEVGLRWDSGEFRDSRGNRVRFDVAQAIISGARRTR